MAHAGAVVASLPADACVAANTAVEGIVVKVNLAAICRVLIAIRETGIAGLDGANSLLTASRIVVGTAHIAARSAVVGVGLQAFTNAVAESLQRPAGRRDAEAGGAGVAQALRGGDTGGAIRQRRCALARGADSTLCADIAALAAVIGIA